MPPYQPWSCLANVLTIVMLANRKRQTAVTRSIICFEIPHAFAHAFGGIAGLSLFQHFLMYPVIVSYTAPTLARGKLLALVCMDIVVACAVGGVWQIYSGIVVFIACMLSSRVQRNPAVLKGIALVTLLLANEVLFCEALLDQLHFPYHVFLELAGMYVFYQMTVSKEGAL